VNVTFAGGDSPVMLTAMDRYGWANGTNGRVAGVDEVGRGPLAGPVMAAAVVIDCARLPAALAARIDDSKRLIAAVREAIAAELPAFAAVGVGEASVEEIDRLNILQASLLAMRRAIAAIGFVPDLALIDGNRAPEGLPCPARCIVGGDHLVLPIAAASIIAKVARDHTMTGLAARCPGYGWERNAGYPTRQHREALARLGPTPHHRRSFRPVAELLAAASP
jgi:ribonuclease HII